MRNVKCPTCLVGLIFALSSVALLAQPEQSGSNDALNVAMGVQDAIQSKSGLSDMAHQIKVTTTDSRDLYLQGSVASTEERAKVEDVATPFVGDYHMRDELMVSASINPASNDRTSRETDIASR